MRFVMLLAALGLIMGAPIVAPTGLMSKAEAQTTNTIAADLRAGLPMTTVLQNALNAGLTITDAVSIALGLASSDKIADIVGAAVELRPASAASIVTAAINKVGVSKSNTIVQAAVNKALQYQTDIEQAAIDASADPTIVAVASASGAASAQIQRRRISRSRFTQYRPITPTVPVIIEPNPSQSGSPT